MVRAMARAFLGYSYSAWKLVVLGSLGLALVFTPVTGTAQLAAESVT
jgi:hypothetical protein